MKGLKTFKMLRFISKLIASPLYGFDLNQKILKKSSWSACSWYFDHDYFIRIIVFIIYIKI